MQHMQNHDAKARLDRRMMQNKTPPQSRHSAAFLLLGYLPC